MEQLSRPGAPDTINNEHEGDRLVLTPQSGCHEVRETEPQIYTTGRNRICPLAAIGLLFTDTTLAYLLLRWKMKNNPSKIVYGSILAVATIIIAASIFVRNINQERRSNELEVYKHFFQLETEKLVTRVNELSNLHHLITNDPTIINSLYKYKHNQTPTQIANLITNKILSNIAQIDHVAAVYLLDTAGNCVFSSRKDFIGNNYSFRPYYTWARQRDSALYMAQGVTSKQTGIYFAQSVRLNDDFLGVAVLKLFPEFFDITPVFSFTPLPTEPMVLRVGLATSQGIFIDTMSNTLHSLEALTKRQQEKLRLSKQFPVKEIVPLPFPQGSWTSLRRSGFLEQSADGRNYYLFARPLETTGLYFLHIVQRTWFHHEYRPPSGFYIGLLVIFGLMLVIACILISLFDQRHRTVLQQSKALAESKDKLRLFSKAVEQSGNSIVITDPQGNIIYVNPHFTNITGYDFDEAFGQNPRILQSGKLDKSTYENMWQTLTRGETWKGVLHNKKKNGELYWEEATISPIIDSKGVITHYIAIKEDISDRIALTQQLKEETEKLQLIVDHAGFGISIITERCFVWSNQIGTQLFGYTSAEEIIGKSTRIVFPSDESYENFGKMFRDAFLEHRVFTIETQLLKKDGSLFWCAITGKPFGPEQETKDSLWIVEDITQRKLYEKELQRAKEKAESASEMKSRLLANISHDIRTPLHGIIGTFNVLETTSLDSDQQKLVVTGSRAAEFLFNLLNNLLDLSKIDAGQLFLESYPFAPRELIIDTGEVLSGQFSDKSLAFTFRIADNVPEVLIGDALRIKQILINLIGNSLKFTEKGSISIFLQGEPEEKTVKLLFRIQDTGIGIPVEKQDRLFEAFTQADNSITRKYGGSGLGLSICKELCTLMGGKIWFESKEGEGTTFFFTCRCAIGSKEQLPAPSPDSKNPTAGTGAKLSILIVDDNEANQEVLRMMLEHEGHTADIAANGYIALEKMITTTYDLIFMDMQMPVMDGLSTTRIIRACESDSIAGLDVYPELVPRLYRALTGSRTPIIALTANAQRKDKLKCQQVGMDKFLGKPFQLDQLRQVLAEYSLIHHKDRQPVADLTDKPAWRDQNLSSQPQPQPTIKIAGKDSQAIRQYLRSRFPFSEEQINTLIDVTIQSITKDLSTLLELADSDHIDYTAIADRTHKVKGSILNLGLSRLAEEIFRMEQAATRNESFPYQEKLAEILSTFTRLAEDGR